MKIYRIAWTGAVSVKDPVKMYGIREIGKNIPEMRFTYFPEEAEKWLSEVGSKTHEIVMVVVIPRSEEWRVNTKYDTDWSVIEWDKKSDEQIAKETNRNIKTVRRMRSSLASHTVLKPDEKPFGYSPRGPGMWNKQIDNLLGLT